MLLTMRFCSKHEERSASLIHMSLICHSNIAYTMTLVLNTSKTQQIIHDDFPLHNNHHDSLPDIDKITSGKYVGIIIDQNLSCEPHIFFLRLWKGPCYYGTLPDPKIVYFDQRIVVNGSYDCPCPQVWGWLAVPGRWNQQTTEWLTWLAPMWPWWVGTSHLGTDHSITEWFKSLSYIELLTNTIKNV